MKVEETSKFTFTREEVKNIILEHISNRYGLKPGYDLVGFEFIGYSDRDENFIFNGLEVILKHVDASELEETEEETQVSSAPICPECGKVMIAVKDDVWSCPPCRLSAAWNNGKLEKLWGGKVNG